MKQLWFFLGYVDYIFFISPLVFSSYFYIFIPFQFIFFFPFLNRFSFHYLCLFVCLSLFFPTIYFHTPFPIFFFTNLRCFLLQREGLSKYNKIYEFDHNLNGRNVKMVMTSVSGHLLNYGFSGAYKRWTGCSPVDLFSVPVFKICPEDSEPIKVKIIHVFILIFC